MAMAFYLINAKLLVCPNKAPKTTLKRQKNFPSIKFLELLYA